MTLSTAVTKATVRRPAELVFMGAEGKNISQVSFASIPLERQNKKEDNTHTAFNDAININITKAVLLSIESDKDQYNVDSLSNCGEVRRLFRSR